ncbi:hypothetical protein JS278_02914 [Acidipropionibacterium virtanenii]|uniref:Right handed beta helix domain-containing protein n=1 Tax=Acidipropionibacterium virtanenii TaxID=2057246 RepID=A0A344UXQ0_9ACTN|nr:hypothetical protein JS278_02914 [Acidipropionibacterium virtanenii]
MRVSSTAPLELQEPLPITRPTILIGGDVVAPPGAPAFDIASSRVRIEGVRIRGSAVPGSTRDPGEQLIRAHGSSAAPLRDVVIRGCSLSASRSDAVRLEWCRGASVLENSIDHVLYAGVMCLSCVDVLVAGNRIVDIPLTEGTVDGYGIAFSDADNTEASRSRRCRAVRNVIELVDREGIDTHGGLGIRITDNTVRGCARGIAVVSGNESRIVAPQRCLVTRNLIDATGARTAALEAVAFRGIEGNPATGRVHDNRVHRYRRPFSIWQAEPVPAWSGRGRAFPRLHPLLTRLGFRL